MVSRKACERRNVRRTDLVSREDGAPSRTLFPLSTALAMSRQQSSNIAGQAEAQWIAESLICVSTLFGDPGQLELSVANLGFDPTIEAAPLSRA